MVESDPVSVSDAGHATHLPAKIIATLALLAAVAPLAIDMYLPAFPEMSVEFDTSASAVQLTLTTFLVGLALGQLVFGPLSDRYGRRPLLLIGTAACAVFSAGAALAPSIELLAAARFVQGFAGAAGIVLGRAVISDRARGAAAAKLFSLLVVINAVAPVIAPLLGGVVVTNFGWRGVFWVLTVLSALMFVCVLALVSETLPKELRTTGGAAAMLGEARNVLRNRRYVGFTLAYAFAFGVMFAYISASPFVLQNVHGLSTAWYTVVFTVNAVGLVIFSVANGGVVAKLGDRVTLRIGLTLLAVFSAGMLINALAGPVLWITLIALWCTMASLGLVIANATTLALGEARQAAGTGSAVLGALQFLLAAAISPLVGIGGEGTALPMAIAMVVSALIALSALALTRGKASADAQ
ncbi:Bcr/CflA family drug resistance efflux transporter [Rhodococcus sp. AD45-ID]|nr:MULTISPECIES: multidrug effflux MFS transporter [unclassified Rhodococcus (in: high G+C Gram-positive bacteria)]MCE4267755.1 multidrug effflux MFS transporter [Rhodococcus globerulus]NRI66257.1 multidrug effflux MFS transporter [Rhodococcus sp. MS16]PSR43559.1 Bcr/CflA family drug resistance efflux transporter [Rhodococcus sp. AD45-ID]ROZ50891.1 Bcr/CflA family efflux MFS transporter [Rhodococcus sp. WS3]